MQGLEGACNMQELCFKDGLLYVDLLLRHGGKEVMVKASKAVIDLDNMIMFSKR